MKQDEQQLAAAQSDSRKNMISENKSVSEEVMMLESVSTTSKRAKNSKTKDVSVNQVAGDKSIEINSNFDLGLQAFNSNKFDEAINYFEKIDSNSNIYDFQKAQWYLAQLYLKIEKIEKSKSILKTIISSNSEFKNQAIELLKTIE